MAARELGYSGAEVARFLGVTTSSINRAAVSGRLPEVRKYLNALYNLGLPLRGARGRSGIGASSPAGAAPERENNFNKYPTSPFRTPLNQILYKRS